MHQVQNLTFHQEVNKQAVQIADYTYSYTSSSRYFVPHISAKVVLGTKQSLCIKSLHQKVLMVFAHVGFVVIT